MDFSLSRERKVIIFRMLLKNSKNFYGSSGDRIIELLDALFNLRTNESKDPRFKDAYEDSVQHLVNNEDWELEYVFFSRFDVTPNDTFKKFLEIIVSSEFQVTEPDRLLLVEELNSQLKKDGYFLDASSFDGNDRPVFGISQYSGDEGYPVGVFENKTSFYTTYTERGDAFKQDRTNVFIISFKHYDYWNDYHLKNRALLYYRDATNRPVYIGEVKFISINNGNYFDHGEFEDYFIKLPEAFVDLDVSYCSLGQSNDYYENLKTIAKGRFRSVLYALKDAAFFVDIADRFEKAPGFKSSLVRSNKSERRLREMKYEIEGLSRADLYKFRYNFTPSYNSNDAIPVDFNFEDELEIPNRMCAIIGKNGVGKTQFITQLSEKLTKLDKKSFEPRIPIFSRIIALSYSPFDSFLPPKGNASFEYVFCSLREESGEVANDRSRASKFGHTTKRIKELGRVLDLKQVLEEFLPEELINRIFKTEENSNSIEITLSELNSIRRELSSGQRLLLESVSSVLAHIRLDSLLLFDEPETHLHPNAIAQLMNSIYELVKRFESFCIITTHSPIIIRELLSRNVFVFDRFEDTLAIRRIGIECFGANLSDITEEVFGTNQIPKHYQIIINGLYQKGLTATEVVSSIEQNDIPISLGLKLYISSLYQQ